MNGLLPPSRLIEGAGRQDQAIVALQMIYRRPCGEIILAIRDILQQKIITQYSIFAEDTCRIDGRNFEIAECRVAGIGDVFHIPGHFGRWGVEDRSCRRYQLVDLLPVFVSLSGDRVLVDREADAVLKGIIDLSPPHIFNNWGAWL